MSSGNPVSTTRPNVNPPPVIAPNANPVAKPSLGARIKTTAEAIWSVVKPILIVLAIVIGAAASTALLGFVTVALSPAILWTAVGVAAVALLYLFFKGCQRASQVLDERKLRKELIQFKLDYPAISQKIQAMQTNGFDRVSIHALIKLHKANEHLKADPNKNQSQSFAEIRKKMTAHLDGELNKNYQPPSLTIPDYCQTEQTIIDYVTAAAEKRDLLIASLNKISAEKALPARANQATFLALADKVAKRLQDKLDQLDNGLTQYLQSHQDRSCPYASLPNYCSKPENTISYIEKIVEQTALVEKAIASLDAELNLKKQEPDKNKAWITLGIDILRVLKDNKSLLDQGILVTTSEFILDKGLLVFITESCENDSLAHVMNNTYDKYRLLNKTITALTNEIQKKVIKGNEDTRLISTAKKVVASVELLVGQLRVARTVSLPGFCHYTGKDYLESVTAIAHKQERIEKAIKHIKSAATKIDTKVDQYFQDTLAKLQKGINVPLPDFFHATRSGLADIIKSKTIIQSSIGAVGPGTYMSNNNEGHYSYGPHTFAIDQGCLIGTSAVFFKGREKGNNTFYDTYSSMWAAVLKNISTTEETIAFIDTSNNDIPAVQQLLKAQNLNIEVIDRVTSDGIRLVFDQTTDFRETPSFGWQGSGLPANMRFRAV